MTVRHVVVEPLCHDVAKAFAKMTMRDRETGGRGLGEGEGMGGRRGTRHVISRKTAEERF